MSKYWVVDTKAKVLSASSFEQDGSEFYFGRSVVPADSIDDAIKALTELLKEDHVEVIEVTAAVDYSSKSWDSDHDDFYDTDDTYEEAKASNNIHLGIFASETTLKEW